MVRFGLGGGGGKGGFGMEGGLKGDIWLRSATHGQSHRSLFPENYFGRSSTSERLMSISTGGITKEAREMAKR
ncbi:hypothetical protein BC938DRAFT_477216 [Jimgerdemannia flammicorona]|uniref:Uncharacterized protein n=1 Tax=Jimgerdemannia flammicorona TaxID=994334 RepID=A0A433QPL9_9FUNG|nr:hypothetical protein BC938DRAFT_477216 [Jimgerdemannia flammicorona]